MNAVSFCCASQIAHVFVPSVNPNLTMYKPSVSITFLCYSYCQSVTSLPDLSNKNTLS